MQKSLKKAFEEFINKDNRVSKLLAKFVNDVLKKGSKVNVRDVESTLDNVVFLYGYISEKDVFERSGAQSSIAHATRTEQRGAQLLRAIGVHWFPSLFVLCSFSLPQRLPDLPVEPSADGSLRERAQRKVDDRKAQDGGQRHSERTSSCSSGAQQSTAIASTVFCGSRFCVPFSCTAAVCLYAVRLPMDQQA